MQHKEKGRLPAVLFLFIDNIGILDILGVLEDLYI